MPSINGAKVVFVNIEVSSVANTFWISLTFLWTREESIDKIALLLFGQYCWCKYFHQKFHHQYDDTYCKYH